MVRTLRRQKGMCRVSFKHVRRGVIHHISRMGLDLEGASVMKQEWVFVVVLVVQMMVCERRQKVLFAGTKQIVSHFWSFGSVFPVLRRCSCFSPVTGGQGCKEIISGRRSKWHKVGQKLGGRERDMVVCLMQGHRKTKDKHTCFKLCCG